MKLVNSKNYNSVIPDYTTKYSDPAFEQARVEINQYLKRYLKDLEAVNLKDGLQSAMDIAQAGNNLVSEYSSRIISDLSDNRYEDPKQ